MNKNMSDKKVDRIEIDRDKCIGAAVCVSIAPEKFELDSDNRATVKEGGNVDDKEILLAAQSCPTQAITVFDSEGKKIS